MNCWQTDRKGITEMSRMNNLKGNRFGRLIALEPIGKYKNGEVIWKCKCDCGNETSVRSGNLRNGHTLSCGCYHDNAPKVRQTKHGGWGTRLYYVWKDMRGRCECEYRREYKYYGAKGVSVCDEWQDFEKFRKWALDNGYDEQAKRGECTIDRIDPFGNYEPDNCRWVTLKEQAKNKRPSGAQMKGADDE